MFRTNILSLWSGSSIARRGKLAFLLLGSLIYRKVFIMESSRTGCARMFNETSWFLRCRLCMLVFGIRVLVRACEADIHEVRRGWNSPCHFYLRAHRILNGKNNPFAPNVISGHVLFVSLWTTTTNCTPQNARWNASALYIDLYIINTY